MTRMQFVTLYGAATIMLLDAPKLCLRAATIPPAPLTLQEEVIGVKSQATNPDDTNDTPSPDGASVAWREKRGGRWAVMLNGSKQGEDYDEVESLRFSPDGQHLSYSAKTGKGWVKILDRHQEFGPYQEIGRCSFSRDSLHHACLAKKAGKWMVVDNGIEGTAYDHISGLSFSPKHSRLLYGAKRRGGWVTVEDGQESSREVKDGYDFLGYTPRDEKLMLVEHVPGGYRLVMGDAEGPIFDVIAMPPSFGATDGHYAYAAARRKRYLVKEERFFGHIVVDGSEGPEEYEAEPLQSTGRALLEALGGRAKSFVLGVHRWFSSTKNGVSMPTFSADGQHLAFAARHGDKNVAVILDGETGPSFESIPCDPQFAADGKLFYAGFSGGKLVVMNGDKKIQELPWPSEHWKDTDYCQPTGNLEGGHFIFATFRNWPISVDERPGKIHGKVFVDGRPDPDYEADNFTLVRTQIAGAEFHVAYAVLYEKRHDNHSFVVLDGLEGKPYDEVLAVSEHFARDGSITYLARSERRFLRVTQSRRVPGDAEIPRATQEGPSLGPNR